MKGGEVVDSQGNPIAADELFEVQVLNAIEYFIDRWLPLPYSAIRQKQRLSRNREQRLGKVILYPKPFPKHLRV